jgi:hypothetical protein
MVICSRLVNTVVDPSRQPSISSGQIVWIEWAEKRETQRFEWDGVSVWWRFWISPTTKIILNVKSINQFFE